MTETIQTAMDRLMTISVEPQDYVAEDGLLYCGSCKTPNPYCYLDNGIIVKLNFAPRGSSTLSERIGRCFQSAS